MTAASGPRGRGGATTPRPRHLPRLPAAAAAAAMLLAAAVYAGVGTSGGPARGGDALARDLEARGPSHDVLGGEPVPGVPTVQRLHHDGVVFTVTVAPARPGPNLVRVDTAHTGPHGSAGDEPVMVGPDEQSLVRARPRPGSDGLWAVVDLPRGRSTVLVTHGRDHLLPFAVEAGTGGAAAPAWSGPDGPECLTASVATLLAAGSAPDGCPADALSAKDLAALRSVVATLASRGVEEIAVQHDRSGRSLAAYAAVQELATGRGVRLVTPAGAPAGRSALLVLSGWADAARSLRAVTSLPLERQPVRTDGTWLAPWLLTPGVVDSTAGAVLALDFDIRDEGARTFSDTLATWLPGQAPTGSGYAAWRAALGETPSPLQLYAATRAAYLPRDRGHAGHETEIAWFPGGTVTPIGAPAR